MAWGFGMASDRCVQQYMGHLLPNWIIWVQKQASDTIHVIHAPEHPARDLGILCLFKGKHSVWMHVRPCAEGICVCMQVQGSVHVWKCAPWGSKESTFISVSGESVIEQKPFRQRVETVTRGSSTREDKKAEVLFCPLFSLNYIFIQFFFFFSPTFFFLPFFETIIFHPLIIFSFFFIFTNLLLSSRFTTLTVFF